MKVVKIVDRNANARSASVLDVLQMSISDIERGKRTASKCVVVFLDDKDNRYRIGFNQAGMSMSELVALLEVMKQSVITNEMEISRNLA